MTDRELLQRLTSFLNNRPVIVGDKATIDDMFQRYMNPPFTAYYRCAIRLTKNEYNEISALLAKIDEHLKETADVV